MHWLMPAANHRNVPQRPNALLTFIFYGFLESSMMKSSQQSSSSFSSMKQQSSMMSSQQQHSFQQSQAM
jgi:hypothetical protein